MNYYFKLLHFSKQYLVLEGFFPVHDCDYAGATNGSTVMRPSEDSSWQTLKQIDDILGLVVAGPTHE